MREIRYNPRYIIDIDHRRADGLQSQSCKTQPDKPFMRIVMAECIKGAKKDKRYTSDDSSEDRKQGDELECFDNVHVIVVLFFMGSRSNSTVLR